MIILNTKLKILFKLKTRATIQVLGLNKEQRLRLYKKNNNKHSKFRLLQLVNYMNFTSESMMISIKENQDKLSRNYNL